jgi:iron complex outermembrane receptor protein
MSHRKTVYPAGLLAAAVSAALPQLALAQTESSRATTLEEVIVTAEKREASLQDTPISIAAFAREELEAMGVFEAGQVGAYAANVNINRQPSSMDNYGYSIRGVGSGETQLLIENTVGLYVDGVYIARSTGSVWDVVDLERIEILRGPQGTLYGRNTIGGAINLITEKPTEEFGFQQKLSAGNRDFFRSTTTIDTGEFADMFMAKLSLNYNEHGGYLDNSLHGNDLGEQESTAWRVALRANFTDNFMADYTYDNSERDSNSELSQIVQVREPNLSLGGAIIKQAAALSDPDRISQLPMYFSPDMGSYSDIDAHSLTLQWDLNESMTLKSITSYREWDSGTDNTDFGGFPSDGATVLNDPTGPGAGTYVPAGEIVSLFRAERVSDNEQFTQEIQLIGDAMDERLQYTLGLYYFEEESNEDNPQVFTLAAEYAFGAQPQFIKSFLCADPTFSNPAACIGKDVVLSAPIFQYGSENESLAAYGQFTYAVSEALDLTVGLRYSEDDKEAYLRQGRITDADGNVLNNKYDNDFDNFSPAITLNYHWNDDVSTYLTWSNGYRSGGTNARSTNPVDFARGFDEEEVTNWEVGIKSDWMDSRLRINGAAFFLEYDDAQVASFAAGEGGASSVISNAGELEIKGIELEVTAIPFEGARVILNYGYLDAEYKEYFTQRVNPASALPDPSPGADPITGNEDISGFATVPRSPEHSGSLILSYDFEPFDFGQLNVRAEMTYTDEMVYHPQLNLYDSRDDQTMINARATLHSMEVFGGLLQVSAWGRNLTDEEYREWGIDFATLGFAIDSFQEKRSYGLDLVYEFRD